MAASSVLKTPMRLLRKTVCGGLRVGSGSAAAWITASWPRTTANASPASGQVRLDVGGRAGRRGLEHRCAEVAHRDVVPGGAERVDGGRAHLPARARDEDPHGAPPYGRAPSGELIFRLGCLRTLPAMTTLAPNPSDAPTQVGGKLPLISQR